MKAIPMFTSKKLPKVPEQFETERLLIRAPQPGDGRAVNDAIRESFRELKQWMLWAQVIPSVAESETYARESALSFRNREELPLLIFRKHDGAYVGSTGMHNIAWDVPRFEIGYWLRTGETGQGYMTEAVNGVTAIAFEQLKAVRVEIRCDARNERSAAVALRCGYALEATLKQESRAPDGSLRDTLIFCKLREDAE